MAVVATTKLSTDHSFLETLTILLLALVFTALATLGMLILLTLYAELGSESCWVFTLDSRDNLLTLFLVLVRIPAAVALAVGRTGAFCSEAIAIELQALGITTVAARRSLLLELHGLSRRS